MLLPNTGFVRLRFKGEKLRKGKVDPNAVTGGKIRRTKGELY